MFAVNDRFWREPAACNFLPSRRLFDDDWTHSEQGRTSEADLPEPPFVGGRKPREFLTRSYDGVFCRRARIQAKVHR